MELQGMEDALACLDTKGSAVMSVSRFSIQDIFNSSDTVRIGEDECKTRLRSVAVEQPNIHQTSSPACGLP